MLKQKLEVLSVANEYRRLHIVAMIQDETHGFTGETKIWVPNTPENAKRFYVGAVFTICVD